MNCNRKKYQAGGHIPDEQKRAEHGTKEAIKAKVSANRNAAKKAYMEEMKYGKEGMKERSNKATARAIAMLKAKK